MEIHGLILPSESVSLLPSGYREVDHCPLLENTGKGAQMEERTNFHKQFSCLRTYLENGSPEFIIFSNLDGFQTHSMHFSDQ